MSLPPITLVALLLGSPARGEGTVVVPISALPVPTEADALGPPTGVVVDRLDARIQAGTDATVRLDWTLTVLKAGWVDIPLVGDGVALRQTRLDGRPLALTRAASGPRRLVQRLEVGVHRVLVEGTVAAGDAHVDLLVARAARGRLETVGEGLSFEVMDGIVASNSEWDLRATERLQVSWMLKRPPPPRPRVVTVETAAALRVDEVGVEGRARLRYRIVDGTVEALVVRMTGPVDEVEATGPGVIGHRLDGDRLTITLAEPLDGAFSVDLSWRGPPPMASDSAAPVPVPEGARGSGWLSVIRGDDSLLVPTPGRGLSAVSTDGLPDWAQGMVPGRPLVAYHVEASERAELTWRRINWSPVDAPPTLVDEARYTVVHAEHGRVWVRAAWQVRNDRNPFLRVRLPDGWEPIGLRVAGLTTQPVRADDGRLLVPLEKSVETLDGLVAFPVELLMVGSEAGWDQRGERRIQTPAVDAPIAYARWELMLPQDVLTRDVVGRPTVVEQWTPGESGMFIGRATRVGLGEEWSDEEDTAAVVQKERRREGRFSQRNMPNERVPSRRTRTSSAVDEKGVSQEYWNRAYSAYKDNRFDDAEELLEQSLTFDPDNASARSLQTNVDVLQGDAVVGEDQQAAANRVRENALSKSGHVVLAQAKVEKEAERRMRAGDTEGAKRAYGELVKMTEQLAGMEQAEAVNQKSRLSSYRTLVDKLERVDDQEVGDELEVKDGKKKSKELNALKGEVVWSPDTSASNAGVGSAEVGEIGRREVGLEVRPIGGLVGGGGYGVGAAPEAPALKGRDAVGGESGLLSDPEELDLDATRAMPAGRSDRSAPARRRARAQVVDRAHRSAEEPLVEIDFPKVEVSGELLKPQGQLLLNRLASVAEPSPEEPYAIVATDSEAGLDISGRFELEEAESDEVSGANPAVRRRSVRRQSEGGRSNDAAPSAPPPPARDPMDDTVLLPSLPTGGQAVASFPVSHPVQSLAYPRRVPAKMAFPLRPPAEPAAEFGLDIPRGIDASTLSLSIPETGTGLLLEQRLLPPDEPLSLTLRYRRTRR